MSGKVIHRAARAEEDLIEIWLQIAVESPAAADRVLDRIELRSKQLVAFPHSGVAREDLGAGLRHLLVENHLLFYRVETNAIEVLRILHGRRNISSEDFQP